MCESELKIFFSLSSGFSPNKETVDLSTDDNGSEKNMAKIVLEELQVGSGSMKAKLRMFGEGPFEDAQESVKALWLFFGVQIYPRISNVLRRAKKNLSSALTEGMVLEHIDMLDEALTIVILDMKGKELAEKSKEGKRIAKHKKRQKRNRVDDQSIEESVMDAHQNFAGDGGSKQENLMKHRDKCIACFRQMEKARNEDKKAKLGWCEVMSKESERIKREENPTGAGQRSTSSEMAASDDATDEAMPMMSIPLPARHDGEGCFTISEDSMTAVQAKLHDLCPMSNN